MAITQIGEEWCPGDRGYRKEFVCDTEADVKNLPECCSGSTAVVCDTGNVYIVNASDRWVAFGGGA